MKIKANLVVFLILVFFAQIRAIASDLSGWNEIKKIIAWELQQDTLAIKDFEASYHATLAILRSGISKENSFYQKHNRLFKILHENVFQRIDESSSLSVLFTQKTYCGLTANLIYMAFAHDLDLPVHFYRGDEITALAVPYKDSEELAFIQITDAENGFTWRVETSYIEDLISEKKITKDVVRSLKRHEIFIHYVMNAKEITLHNLAAIYMYFEIVGNLRRQDWHNFFRTSVSAVKYNTDDELFNILKKSIELYLNEFWKVPFNMQFMIEKLSNLEPWSIESEEIKFQTIYFALSNLSNNGRIELARELESATRQKLKYVNNMNESIKNAQNNYLRVLIDHYSSFSLYSEVVILLKELYHLNSTDYKYQNYYKERIISLSGYFASVNKQAEAITLSFELKGEFPSDERVKKHFDECDKWCKNLGNSKYSNEEVDSVLAIYESKFTADTLSSLNRYLYVSALYTAGLNAIKNRKEKSAFEIFTKAHSIRPDDTLVTESLAMTAKIIEDQRKFKIRK